MCTSISQTERTEATHALCCHLGPWTARLLAKLYMPVLIFNDVLDDVNEIYLLAEHRMPLLIFDDVLDDVNEIHLIHILRP